MSTVPGTLDTHCSPTLNVTRYVQNDKESLLLDNDTPGTPDAKKSFTKPSAPEKPFSDTTEVEKQKLVRDTEFGIQAAIKSISDYGLPSTEGEWLVLRFNAAAIYLASVGRLKQGSVDLLKRASDIHLQFLKRNNQDDQIKSFIATDNPDVFTTDAVPSMGGDLKCTTGAPALIERQEWENIISDYYLSVFRDIGNALKQILKIKWVAAILTGAGLQSLQSLKRISGYFTNNITMRNSLDTMLTEFNIGLGPSIAFWLPETSFDSRYWGAPDTRRQLRLLLDRKNDNSPLGKTGSTFDDAFNTARDIYTSGQDSLAKWISPAPTDVADNWVNETTFLKDYRPVRLIADFVESGLSGLSDLSGLSFNQSMASVGISLFLISIAHLYYSYYPARMEEFLVINDVSESDRWKLELKQLITNLKENYQMTPNDRNEINACDLTINTSSQEWINQFGTPGNAESLATRVENVNAAIATMNKAEKYLRRKLERLPTRNPTRRNRSPGRTREPLVVDAVVDAFLAKRLAAQQLARELA